MVLRSVVVAFLSVETAIPGTVTGTIDAVATGEGFLGEAFGSGDGPLAYLLVFLGAATPWLEILVIVPLGVAYGLNPVAVAIAAFLGNAITV